MNCDQIIYLGVFAIVAIYLYQNMGFANNGFAVGAAYPSGADSTAHAAAQHATQAANVAHAEAQNAKVAAQAAAQQQTLGLNVVLNKLLKNRWRNLKK